MEDFVFPTQRQDYSSRLKETNAKAFWRALVAGRYGPPEPSQTTREQQSGSIPAQQSRSPTVLTVSDHLSFGKTQRRELFPSEVDGLISEMRTDVLSKAYTEPPLTPAIIPSLSYSELQRWLDKCSISTQPQEIPQVDISQVTAPLWSKEGNQMALERAKQQVLQRRELYFSFSQFQLLVEQEADKYVASLRKALLSR